MTLSSLAWVSKRWKGFPSGVISHERGAHRQQLSSQQGTLVPPRNAIPRSSEVDRSPFSTITPRCSHVGLLQPSLSVERDVTGGLGLSPLRKPSAEWLVAWQDRWSMRRHGRLTRRAPQTACNTPSDEPEWAQRHPRFPHLASRTRSGSVARW